MGIFLKKTTYALSDILKGIQHAINSAQTLLQAQQIRNLSNFWGQEGKPLTQKLQVGEQEVDVPLITLVPHSHLSMDDVEIKFKTRVQDIASHSFPNRLDDNNVLTYTDLQIEMDGIKPQADDIMEITIRFKAKETPEGVARLMDEYNKQM